MKKFVCVFLLLYIAGCGGGSGYSNYSPNTSYIGFSSHFKKTKGNSNLPNGYKDPPVLDANDSLTKSRFVKNAKEYLAGVINDLKEVNDKADNATKKINAVVDAANFGYEYFTVSYVGSVFTLGESNFGIFDYPEFPKFNYFFSAIKPYKPLFLDDEFMVENYNNQVRSYNREVADFAATIKAYIEDAEHYIKNCKNDYEEIRQKGLKLSSSIKSLNIDVEVDL
jgi:hypothetical protein